MAKTIDLFENLTQLVKRLIAEISTVLYGRIAISNLPCSKRPQKTCICKMLSAKSRAYILLLYSTSCLGIYLLTRLLNNII